MKRFAAICAVLLVSLVGVAIAYTIEYTGKDEAFGTSEIERSFVDPGQALAYKVGPAIPPERWPRELASGSQCSEAPS